jgi:ubiquinone/menaquinone biosynthesis C-methylase UbiE
VGSADPYYLGYSAAETQRLQRQAAELADDSAWLFDQLEPLGGARVLEIGCGPQGCLDVLSERVGPSGSVLGVERSEEAVILARGLAAERELSNVEVICGDARHTSLPRQSFDVVTARLVLVNIPEPEEVLAEAIALLRAGGRIAFHEASWPAQTIDPPLPAWVGCMKSSRRTRRRTGSTSSSAAACRGCCASTVYVMFRSGLSSTPARSAMGDACWQRSSSTTSPSG